MKCEREEDKECFQVVKSAANVSGRHGSLFGSESRYVRLSLVKSQDDFNLLLERMEALLQQEPHNKKIQQGNERNASMTFGVGHHFLQHPDLVSYINSYKSMDEDM